MAYRSDVFGDAVGEMRAVQAELRALGYCAFLAPFDQGKNNDVASWCARDAGVCEAHGKREVFG